MTPGGRRAGGHRLVLLRHAKAEPVDDVRDELRPLTLNGRRRSTAVGAELAASGLVPEHVLVSSAVRTRQTWELVHGALAGAPQPEVDVTDRLYSANPAAVIELVRDVDERVRTLLVVGHEPTMSSTAALLGAAASPEEESLLQGIRAGLPTGGYAVLEVADWAGVGRGTARLLDVLRPG